MPTNATSAQIFPCWQSRIFAIPSALMAAILLPALVHAQSSGNVSADARGAVAFGPWSVLAAGLAIFVPVGLTIIAVAGMERGDAWRTALGTVAAASLASLAYWAVGFGLQFGGIGLVYPEPALQALVWEWSPLSVNWGSGWGVAGLTGWLVSGASLSWLAYALFLAHLPWIITGTALVVMALRGRAPIAASAVVAFLLGGVILPLAGNWIQGGGWLNALGRNLNLGHGFIDFGGAGSIYLVAAAFGLSALLIWGRRDVLASDGDDLPPVRWPLLAVIGALLLLGGAVGWLWANPLHTALLSEASLLRGTVNVLLASAAGAFVPLLYTWFVASESHPTLSARGLAAGMVAGFAIGPFVQPGMAALVGLLAGATVPFVTYLVDNRLNLDDATGLIGTVGMPAIIGLLSVGLFADGTAGLGWQMTGMNVYLGVTGQGVSGLFVTPGNQPDFPGQLQAQLIGVTALVLWGMITGLVVNYPLALIAQGLRQSEVRRTQPRDGASKSARLAPTGVDELPPQNAETLARGAATEADV